MISATRVNSFETRWGTRCFTIGLRKIAVAILALTMTASYAQATPLNLVTDVPDVTSLFVAVSFDSGTSTFTANGFATDLDLDGIAPPDYTIDGGAFSLSATLAPTTLGTDMYVTGGSISITGTIPALGYNSGTLLTGTVDDVGYLPAGGEIFEFLFAVTGGDLAPLYPSGQRGGTIINAVNSGFGGSFAASFANDGFSGTSDAFPIPEPSTVAMLGLGGIALLLMTVSKIRKRQG